MYPYRSLLLAYYGVTSTLATARLRRGAGTHRARESRSCRAPIGQARRRRGQSRICLLYESVRAAPRPPAAAAGLQWKKIGSRSRDDAAGR